MRAILRCETSFDEKQLETYFSQTIWWPTVDQGSAIVEGHKSDIISHIAPDDRPLAESTFVFTIYDDATRTWGIVSRPTHHALAFRLKNPIAERLKLACERLVKDLEPVNADQGKMGSRRAFRFEPSVEVLEPNSQDHALAGEILPPKRLLFAIQERRSEAWVGAFTAVVGVVLLVLTSPPIKPVLLARVEELWRPWVSGNMERVSTAALVTLAISWFEVLLHWFDIRRRSSIRWTVE